MEVPALGRTVDVPFYSTELTAATLSAAHLRVLGYTVVYVRFYRVYRVWLASSLSTQPFLFWFALAPSLPTSLPIRRVVRVRRIPFRLRCRCFALNKFALLHPLVMGTIEMVPNNLKLK